MSKKSSVAGEKEAIRLVRAIVLALIAGLGLSGCQDEAGRSGDAQPANSNITAASRPTVSVPRLLDLGAGTCIPCKKMAPILDELKEEYAGALEVEFIDVWEDRIAGVKYGIQSIPTQIFYAPDGKELFRHEGFFAKQDILAKWKELGFPLDKQPSGRSAPD